MIDKNKQVAIYWLVDVVNNSLQMLEPVSEEELKKYSEIGFAFIVEYEDKTRQAIPWYEVDFDLLPKPLTINIVEQEYFVPWLESLLDYLEETEIQEVAAVSTLNAQTTESKFAKFKTLAEEIIARYKPNLEK